MADPYTAARPSLDLIAGGCGARPQLRSGIKDISVASRLRISLTLVGVLLIGTLVLQDLNVRFLHNRRANPGSETGGLWCSTAASQLCKVHPSVRVIHEVTGLNGGLAIPEPDPRFRQNHCSDTGSDFRRLLVLTPASQRYKRSLCRIKTHDLAGPCEGWLYKYLVARRA